MRGPWSSKHPERGEEVPDPWSIPRVCVNDLKKKILENKKVMSEEDTDTYMVYVSLPLVHLLCAF